MEYGICELSVAPMRREMSHESELVSELLFNDIYEIVEDNGDWLKIEVIGTINFDYRSLVHHFENGVWLYKHDVLKEIKTDMKATISESIEMTKQNIKDNSFICIATEGFRSIVFN